MNVVIVEDQADLATLIAEHLERAGIRSEIAGTGEDALNLIDPEVHDLMILDRGLPDMDGIELLKILREDKIKIPALILTAMDELGDKVAGLNSGADDYMVKPFEMDELIARMRALNRRPAAALDVVLKFGNIEFSPAESTILVRNNRVDLSSKEREALERLIRLPGRVVSKSMLQSALYGHGDEGSQNSVEVVVHRLRKRLEEAGADIEVKTLRGIGYMLKPKTAEESV